jgi:hypothetical protein
MCSLTHRSPGEDALDGNDDVFTVPCNGSEKYLRVGFDVTIQDNLSIMVDDAQVHAFGMKIDSIIKFVLHSNGKKSNS